MLSIRNPLYNNTNRLKAKGWKKIQNGNTN